MISNRTLTTQQIASALGLRPATVQMYARNRQIPFDQTPGGHRRFNIDEVREALGAGNAAPDPAPSRSRGTHGWLIGATELDSWADRRTSQEELPDAIRILVLASVPELISVDFRSGDGVRVRGWDGQVNAARRNPWVPAGHSAWEISTGDPGRRANENYQKRTKNPLGLNPADTVFVFVTPRRWDGRDSWATTRRAENKWRNVLAYDADSLEQWLDFTPSAHVRITKMLGRDPEGASDITSAWGRWAGRTSPVLPMPFVTSGRDQEMSRLWQWLHDDATAVSVVADSQDEAFAFIAASLLQTPQEQRTAVESQAMVIRSPDAWDEVLARSGTKLILIPTFPNPVTAEAIDAGHHVVIPLDRSGISTGTPIALPRLRREPAIEALVAAGEARNKAEELATIARRSLTMFQRRFAVDATVARPPWAQADCFLDIMPALLAGAWRDDVEADRQIVASLAHRPYEDVVAALTRWQVHPDAPVRKVGNLWFITSKEDTWMLTSSFLTADHLRRFRERTIEVIASPDPALELEPGKRWSAAISGHVRPWSSHLRNGLADSIALVGTRDVPPALPGGLTTQQFADEIVRTILDTANADESGNSWASLHDVLPVLAEASAEQFLTAVDTGLSSGALMKVFDPAVEEQPFDSPRHTGLLRALELLAWEPMHLGSAAQTLAKLAERDPGGRYANRPMRSLRQIFLPWVPHTRASVEERLDVLDRLRHTSPDIAWKLALSLLPQLYDTGDPTHEPRWREGEPDPRPTISRVEWDQHTSTLVQRLINDAGHNGTRWSEIVSSLQSLPEAPHKAVVDALAKFDPASFGDDHRDAIVEAIRKLVHQHRRFPNAQRAWPLVYVDRMETQLHRFEYIEPVRGSAWLFRQGASIPHPLNEKYDAEEAALEHERQMAVRNILHKVGIDGIWDLGLHCDQQAFLGKALADVDSTFDPTIIEALDDEELSRQAIARGYVIRRFELSGWEWADTHLAGASGWPVDRLDRFLLCLTPNEGAFDRVDSLGAEVASGYWRNVWPLLVRDEKAKVRAVFELHSHGRPAAAVSLIDSLIKSGKPDLTDSLPSELLVSVLTAAANQEEAVDVNMFAFYVGNILNSLETRTDVDRAVLAQLEFLYIPFFEYSDRRPTVLHEELTSNPNFFVDLISLVFKPEGDETTSEVTRDDRVRAELCYRLLRSWHSPPQPIATDAHPALRDWVESARRLLIEKGLIRIGDENIGHVLRYVPEASDGTWPTVAVRELIEDVASRDLERGIEIEVCNSRGTTFRGLTTGGAEERASAKQFREYARLVGNKWSHTGRMLNRIADGLEDDARREDQLAEIREDFWS
jgi:excisionase family DNA binding protein